MVYRTESLNTLEEIWGPDATEFKPERWLAPLSTSTEHNPGLYAKTMSFLDGPRSCIGFRMALAECVFPLCWDPLTSCHSLFRSRPPPERTDHPPSLFSYFGSASRMKAFAVELVLRFEFAPDPSVKIGRYNFVTTRPCVAWQADSNKTDYANSALPLLVRRVEKRG